MRVLILNLHKSDGLGGAEIQCDILAEGLKKKGHDVLYVTPSGKSTFDYQESYEVTPVNESVSQIVSVVKSFNPDIIYWRSYKRLFTKVVKRLNFKFPIIFAVSHVHDLDWKVFLNHNKRSSVKSLLKMIRDMLQTFFQIKGYKYISAMTTLNAEYLPLLPTESKRYIANSMPSDLVNFIWKRPYCVWVANLKEPKQPELFVELARVFEGIGIDFLMVGKFHSEYPSLKWIVDHDGTPSNFYYIGEASVKKVNGILRNCLFHIHTCRPEGFGNVFIQAWLMHKTSVSFSFDPGGFISTEKIGVFADGDWRYFVSEVEKLIKDEVYRSRFADRALLFASANFSTGKMVTEIESFMLETIEKSMAPKQKY